MTAILHLAASIADLARRAVWFVVPVPLLAGAMLAAALWAWARGGGA